MRDMSVLGAIGIALAFVLAVLSVGCSNLLGSEAGLPVPKDPGTVVVTVEDQASRAIEGVTIQVHDIPNRVGSTFSISQRTNSGGVAEFTFIPAGRCRVQVTPPSGYSTGADESIKPIEVVKDATVRVAFVLARD
jgi:hypothetical protein